MFTYFSPDSRVPADHPLRRIKADADRVLRAMNVEFDRLYANTGRPSIPPERLLKASLLIALYSVRSDRMFCEMLEYNILFRWFLDMSLDERGLDQSAFSRNVAIAASSGSGMPASSQPCAPATARKTASFSRPITPVRAISRSESPARNRTSACRYWNISNLLRPTAGLPSKKPGG